MQKTSIIKKNSDVDCNSKIVCIIKALIN